MRIGLMQEQWDLFNKILPKGASVIQRREMRRAFYAGAQCILFRVISALAPDTEPTEGDIQIMEDLDKELQDFAKMVARGQA